ncbi:MAG: hypothetical protein WB630_04340, partial [Candidatus Acidiferrales bacterium]
MYAMSLQAKMAGLGSFLSKAKCKRLHKSNSTKNKHIPDRLMPEMLESYCAALGIRAFDDTF